MTNNYEPQHPLSSDEAKRDSERIAAELTGADVGTDPFVAAVRATRMPMIITNPRLPDNPVVFANDAFCRLTGYSRVEILGRNCRFLQGAETDPETVKQIGDAVRNARSIEIDIRNHRKDGEPFWNRLLMAPVRDAEGDLAYFFASQVDVTLERERLAGLESHNAALTVELAGRLHEQQERERELRFTLECGRFGAWSLDLVTNEMTSTPAFRENFGRDAADSFSYAELRRAVHPDDLDRMQKAVDHSVATGADYDIEYRALTPSGALRWIGIRARPSYADDGRPLKISGVCLDVTEDKRAYSMRHALIRLTDRFRDMQDIGSLSFEAARILGETLGVSRAGYGTINSADETITIERDWNAPGVHSLAGVLRFRDYGTYIEDLKRGETVVFADAEKDPRTAATADALKAISAQAVVNMPLTERGGFVALLYLNHATPRDWREDELAFVREVAERTRVTIERRRAEQELAELAASLEQQVAERTRDLVAAEEALRQSQKMEAVGQLTGGVAHDFNNLLTVIRSSVDLLARPNLPEDRRTRYIGAISDTVARASKLTGQLLAFARRQTLHPEVFDVSQSIATLSDMVRTLTGSRVRIVTNVPNEACYINADPSQFDTSIINMAVNARDAMRGEGELRITVQSVREIPPVRSHPATAGSFVSVSVEDTGSGIPPEHIERIFEPFFTTKDVGQGTGLGLSQVFGFAKQSGGEIRVESKVGAGTTFVIYLPSAERGELAAAPDAELEPLADGHGAYVLIVEDNNEVGTFATQSLSELGYRTKWASNAADALNELAQDAESFDVVFSDVVMPGMNGIDFARSVKQMYRDLPIVLTSGYSHVLAEKGSRGFELLPKPYSIEQLSRTLRRVGQRRKIARNSSR